MKSNQKIHINSEGAKTILRKKADHCPHCGEFHVADYGGEKYCQSAHHVAHGPTGTMSPGEKELARRFGAKEEDLC